MERLQAICKKHELLIIVDEVVMGLGRTGAWFGYQHYGLVPGYTLQLLVYEALSY
jgi:taurine-pyruvate aminotransferase